jgi:hypothetical protein
MWSVDRYPPHKLAWLTHCLTCRSVLIWLICPTIPYCLGSASLAPDLYSFAPAASLSLLLGQCRDSSQQVHGDGSLLARAMEFWPAQKQHRRPLLCSPSDSDVFWSDMFSEAFAACMHACMHGHPHHDSTHMHACVCMFVYVRMYTYTVRVYVCMYVAIYYLCMYACAHGYVRMWPLIPMVV